MYQLTFPPPVLEGSLFSTPPPAFVICGLINDSQVQPLWRTVWRYLRKLYIELPYDPAIPLLGIYPDKTCLERDTCIPHVHCSTLFTIAKTWKKPKCPLTDDWIRKMWYVYTMEYYSAIKKNKIMPLAATWMELETLILSEVTQKEKDKYPIISHIWNLINATNEPFYRKENCELGE